VLNSSFTIKIWARPETSKGVLFSANRNKHTEVGDEDFLTLIVSSSTQKQLQFVVAEGTT
jgi:hypothetical protein